MNVEIYGAEWCKPCQNSKQRCIDKGYNYSFKDITADPQAFKECTQKLGREPKSVPQIFIDGEHIGSSKDFLANY